MYHHLFSGFENVGIGNAPIQQQHACVFEMKIWWVGFGIWIASSQVLKAAHRRACLGVIPHLVRRYVPPQRATVTPLRPDGQYSVPATAPDYSNMVGIQPFRHSNLYSPPELQNLALEVFPGQVLQHLINQVLCLHATLTLLHIV